jgi:superfamily II DNA helicase RecQ
MRTEIHIIIATIAFGMGINKPDVRFVIHTTLPKSLENYCQEVGRAGRDGRASECILYYSYADRKRLEHFIVTNTDNTMGRKNENLQGLYKIIEFCEEPYLCRRKVLLGYLSEDFRSQNCN